MRPLSCSFVLVNRLVTFAMYYKRSRSLRRIRCCRIHTGKKKLLLMLRQYCSTPERRSPIVYSTSAARFWCWRTVPGRAVKFTVVLFSCQVH